LARIELDRMGNRNLNGHLNQPSRQRVSLIAPINEIHELHHRNQRLLRPLVAHLMMHCLAPAVFLRLDGTLIGLII
jgi:hypothetical protein